MDEHREILELAAVGELPNEIDDHSAISVNVFRELYEAGYVAAVDASTFDGRAYLEPRITMAGRQLLEQYRAPSETNISSYGQSGGTTAHTVYNVTNSAQLAREPVKPWWKSWAVIIGGLLAAAAALIAVLQFFGIGPLELAMSDKPTINVTSYNQTGGITAHTVYNEPRRRQMTESDGAQIRQHVPTDAAVRVATMFADAEAMAFAIQVREWMLKNGYAEVGGVDEHGLTQPVFGQRIEQRDDGSYLIFIGARD